MARYDVFPNLGGSGYLLDVQADILEDLSTRVHRSAGTGHRQGETVRRLNPTFTIDGKQYSIFTHLMVTIPLARLAEPRTSLLHHHDESSVPWTCCSKGF